VREGKKKKKKKKKRGGRSRRTPLITHRTVSNFMNYVMDAEEGMKRGEKKRKKREVLPAQSLSLSSVVCEKEKGKGKKEKKKKREGGEDGYIL